MSEAGATEFSVVIPAYNRAGTIATALRSVLSQDHRPSEIIVVDDGSTDATAEAVTAFGDRVRLIRQSNQGASEARNRGVREARHRWIAFLDSDDYWCDGHLRRIAAAIDGTGGRGVLYFSDARCPPDAGGELLWTVCGFSIHGPFELIEDAAPWALGPFQPMMIPASVFDRRTYLEVGGLRADFRSREDTHLYLKILPGRPACAVAGCGAEATAQDTSGGRLTAAHGPQKPDYWRYTVVMYEEVLAGDYPLSPSQRRDLRERVATAHIHLARFALRARHVPSSLGHLARSFARHPRRFTGGLLRWSLAPLRRTPQTH